MIDLRSDTVTQPTPEMRRAMAQAEVGDDVFGEDPTVRRLEERCAELFGQEKALFVPTGSMGNQIAVKLHTRPGQEVICESRGHIYNWEMGMVGAFSGCIVRPVAAAGGRLSWELIEPHLAPPVYYRARTGLICLENTHNMAGGTVLPLELVKDVLAGAVRHGIPVHLDGARIFNAAAATGLSVRELSQGFDSVMFCFSKGLAAPVGSMLLGSRDFIGEAWRVRKMLGGGMRQVGVLAAAAEVALSRMPSCLAEDHSNARLLAEGLSELPGFEIDLGTVETNIVIVDLTVRSSSEIVESLQKEGVLAVSTGASQLRFVTHKDISRSQIVSTVETMRKLFA